MALQLATSTQFDKEPRIAVISFSESKNELSMLFPCLRHRSMSLLCPKIFIVNKLFTDCFVFSIGDQVMKVLQMLKTMLAARGLEVLLLGKEVITPSEVSLGVVIAIGKELSQDKIWMVIDNQAREATISIEQIVSVTNKVILSDELPPASLAANGNSGF